MVRQRVWSRGGVAHSRGRNPAVCGVKSRRVPEMKVLGSSIDH